MKIDNSLSIRHLMSPFNQYLSHSEVTELCINEPGHCYTEAGGVWTRHETPEVSIEDLESLAVAVAAFNRKDISDSLPIMSAVLGGSGERVQVVVPPVCPLGTVSITIRKPSKRVFALSDYPDSFFNGHTSAAELSNKVEQGKTLVVCGETSSGKTTLIRSLLQEIPVGERIITIEDTAELPINSHDNVAPLYFDALTTASDCLKSALRMRPDRLILGECRGGEAFDFLNICASGHQGSITSIHAGSVELCRNRLAMLCLMNENTRSYPYEAVTELVASVIDGIIHVTKGDNGRYITESWFK